MEKKFIIEDNNCLSCSERGNCPIEAVGGEGKALFPLEMEICIGAVEAGMAKLMANWNKQTEIRERLAKLVAEKKAAGDENYSMGESAEGSEYFLFSLRQLEQMAGIIEIVKPIVETAKERAMEAWKARSNKAN